MRILVVNWLDRENPRAGGAEMHLHQVFGRLVERGHDVTLVASGWEGLPARTELDGIDVHRVGSRNGFLVQVRGYVRRNLTSEPWDVLVEDLNKVPVFTPRWGVAPVALLVHHLFGSTAFQEASPPFALATWLLERPIPWVYGGVPTVAVSESTRQDLIARGLNGSDIMVVPNGVDLERYTPGPDEARYPDPSLLYLGRVQRYKRVDLVIRALAWLREHGVPARLRVAGRGDALDELRRLASELGVADAVEFAGFVSESTKLDLLRRSWVHVLTSPKEGWGITNLEAAACGTPTVASDSPGLRDSVVDGETGRLVPHDDVPALGAALAGLLTDPDRRRAMGRAARAFAETFSWAASADGVEAFLRDRVCGPDRRS